MSPQLYKYLSQNPKLKQLKRTVTHLLQQQDIKKQGRLHFLKRQLGLGLFSLSLSCAITQGQTLPENTDVAEPSTIAAPPAPPIPPTSPSPTSSAQTQSQIIKAIHIEYGKDRISSYQKQHPEEQIRRQLKTKIGTPLNQEILNNDITRLFRLNWFYDVRYRVNGNVITFHVVEKRRVAVIAFAGNTKMRQVTLKNELITELGDFVNNYLIARDIETIKGLYKKKGYQYIEVKPRYENVTQGTRLTFIITENPEVRIREVIIKGNNNVDTDELLDIPKNKRDGFWNSGFYDEEAFKEDKLRMRNRYIAFGWINATVESEGLVLDPIDRSPFIPPAHRQDDRWTRRHVAPTPIPFEDKPLTERTATLTFIVNEGRRYRIRKVDVRNNKIIASKELLEKINPPRIQSYPDEKALKASLVKLGGFYSPSIIEKSTAALKNAYGDLGYMFTRAIPRETLVPGTNEIDIAFDIQEGHPTEINEINILGNDKTRDVVIRRELKIFPGEQLTSAALNESKDRLYSLDFFDSIDVALDEVEGTGKTNINIKVKEKNTGSFNFGIGFSSVDNLVGNVGITQRNFDWRSWPYPTGDGQHFNVTLRTGSNNRTVAFNFLEPYVNDLPIRFGFGAFTSRRQGSLYDEARKGGHLSLGKEMWDNIDVTVGYNITRTTIDDIDPAASQALQEEFGTTTGTWISFNIEYKDLNRRFLPTKGKNLFVRNNIYTKALGGDLELVESVIGGRWVKSIHNTFDEKHHIITNKLSARVIGRYGNTKRVPIFNRYFAGGISTVRGYRSGDLSPQDSNGEFIGGNFMPLYNLEYTMPLSEEILRGAIFFDAGFAFANTGEFSFGGIHKGAGFGLRIQTPLSPAPIQLDYGFALDRDDGKHNKGRFDFSFGTQF